MYGWIIQTQRQLLCLLVFVYAFYDVEKIRRSSDHNERHRKFNENVISANKNAEYKKKDHWENWFLMVLIFMSFFFRFAFKRTLPTGLEPVTLWLTARRSTNWAIGEYTIFRGAIRFIHILQNRTIPKLHTTCTEIWLLPDSNRAFQSWKDCVINL